MSSSKNFVPNTHKLYNFIKKCKTLHDMIRKKIFKQIEIV